MKENFKNSQVIIVNAHGDLEHRKVISIGDGVIETDRELIPASEGKKYFNNLGGVTYLFNVDLPSKVEMENLQRLRRSTALKRIFDYDKEKGISLAQILPYIIAVIAIMF